MENDYDKRIGELERDIDELKEVLEFARKDQEQNCKIAKKLLKENNQLRHENEKREKEYQELYNECQRHKMLRFKNAREIQARVNAFNRIVDSLKGQVPDWIIKELETAQILECDYEED